MLRFEIVGEAEKQSAVLGAYCFPLDDPADCAAAYLPLLAAIEISDLVLAEKQSLTDQFDIIEAIVLATFLDHFRDQVEDKRRMHSEAFAVTDASI